MPTEAAPFAESPLVIARRIGKQRVDTFRPKVQQGLQLEAQQRLAEAERLYAEILATDSTHPWALYRTAILCAGRGDDIEALRLIQMAMKRAPLAEIVADCGLILDRLGQTTDALATYDRALILDPANERALLHRGKLLTKLGENARAAASFERLLS